MTPDEIEQLLDPDYAEQIILEAYNTGNYEKIVEIVEKLGAQDE